MTDDVLKAANAQNEYQQVKQAHAAMSVPALIRSAVEQMHAEERDPDQTTGTFAISALQQRATPATLAAMIGLLQSDDVYEREVAAWVLGQMQRGEYDYHAFQDEAVVALVEGLTRWRDDPRTLEAIGIALGHRNDPRAIAPLLALKDHPDKRVRYGVTHGLLYSEDPRASATLLELTRDPENEVRDWATFAFTMHDSDSEEIREALFARTNDSDLDIRIEAIEALAQRHDPRTVTVLLSAVADGANGAHILDAAIVLADPRLFPALIGLRGHVEDWLRDSLAEAIAACSPDLDTSNNANKLMRNLL